MLIIACKEKININFETSKVDSTALMILLMEVNYNK